MATKWRLLVILLITKLGHLKQYQEMFKTCERKLTNYTPIKCAAKYSCSWKWLRNWIRIRKWNQLYTVYFAKKQTLCEFEKKRAYSEFINTLLKGSILAFIFHTHMLLLLKHFQKGEVCKNYEEYDYMSSDTVHLPCLYG